MLPWCVIYSILAAIWGCLILPPYLLFIIRSESVWSSTRARCDKSLAPKGAYDSLVGIQMVVFQKVPAIMAFDPY